MLDPYSGLIYLPRDEPFAQVSAEVIAARLGQYGPIDQVGSDSDSLIYEIEEDDKWSSSATSA